MFGFFLLPLYLRSVLEPENQSPVSVCGGIVQKGAPEVFAELRNPGVLPPEIPDELLHGYPALTHALDLLVRGILLRLGLIKLLAQLLKAALVQSLILRHGGVQVNHVLHACR